MSIRGPETGTGGRPLRISIVTNIPAPYRIPVYELVGARADVDLTVIYCASREPNRHWRLRPSSTRSIVLRGRAVTVRGRYVHINPGVVRALHDARPDVVITTGYNPTHLLAVAYCVFTRAAHVVQTDGTFDSERDLGPLHRVVRRAVQRVSRAFVGASDGSARLFRSYGVSDPLLFRSVLAIDNGSFRAAGDRDVDLLFSGQLVHLKNPLFALDVAESAAALLGRRVSMVVAGSGPLERAARDHARALVGVDVTFVGFLQQGQLPELYTRAKVLLFPTAGDAWGIVANEASAAGTPVITTDAAGAARELVQDGTNGRVLPLDLRIWAQATSDLLQDEEMRSRFGRAARASADRFTYRSAADGLVDASQAAARRPARILIDVLGAPPRSGGMRLHATEVLQHWLTEWGGVDDIVVVGPPWIRELPQLAAARRIVTWRNDNALVRMVGQQLVTPVVFLLTRRRYLISTNSVLSPLAPSRRATVTAHDWRHLVHPEEFSRSQLLYRRLWRRSVLRAQAVVCVSDKTRDETERLVGRHDAVTIENGRDHARRWAVRSSRPDSAPAGRFLLTFGHHTNKRPELVVRALPHLEDQEMALVVLGARGDMADAVQTAADHAGASSRTVIPGFVSDDDYRWFVTNAAVVVVASSDEGFGLPLAEAAAIRVPAVVARDSGVAELFAESAIVAEPTESGIADAIRSALRSPLTEDLPVGNTWRDVVARLRAVVLQRSASRETVRR